MNQITRETKLPIDFNILLEDYVENSENMHRRGSNFFVKSIIEINEEYFPTLDRSLDGFWETNQYIWDDDYGFEKSDIIELNRVEKITKMIPTTNWELVKD